MVEGEGNKTKDRRKSLARIVGEHPFLKGLKTAHLERIAQCASEVHFRTNELLFRPGEQADTCYLLRRGRVAIEMPHETYRTIILETLAESSVIGWSWFVPPYEWCFGARAITLTNAIALDAVFLRSALEDDHELGYEMMKRLANVFAQRLRAVRLQLLDHYEELDQEH